MGTKFVCALAVVSLLLAAGVFSNPAPTDQITKSVQQVKPLNRGSLINILPHINKVTVFCGGYPCNDFSMFGTGFGSTQGIRKILIDGQESSQYQWHTTEIGFHGPSTSYDHTSHFGIYENGKLISNDFTQKFPADVDGAAPIQGPPGTHITIKSFGAGPTQGSKIVMMGTAPMQVLSWTNSGTAQTIVAIVPQLNPGKFPIDIYEGELKISVTGFSYTVQ